MREKVESLLPCPISKSSNHDMYNDICKATGQTCPFYADEGMSVCKNKAKCLAYFAKSGAKVNSEEVMKLIVWDKKSCAEDKSQYTNTIKRDHSMQKTQSKEKEEESDSFLKELEAALDKHEDPIEQDEEET